MSPRNPSFSGVIPPVVTPLTTDGELDTKSLERLVGFLLEGGVTGLFALGSSGEMAYLTPRQQDAVIDVIVGAAGGQVPVLVGAIEPTTNRVIERAEMAAKRGADAIVTTAPFYARTHESEIERHFRTVASAVPLPLLAYDIPVCVHSKLAVDQLLSLAADGVLAGVKDSSGDDVSFRRLALAGAEVPRFALLTGHEAVVDAMLLGGADGSVPGLGNVDPHGYARLDAAARAGDWRTARTEQDRLARLFDIVLAADTATASGTAAGLGSFKTALMLRGIIDTQVVSPPMRPLDERETETVRAHLVRAGLL
ncbi:dihydrodipicolinate synthase family protein [Streptomyces oceani]|uniref:Glucose dehydrogenase n=1 Tax=Streptomyces oceani TaxID=1075402 RepID=A0A1E7KES2_9ACTN|nr:dihydrodipicolinate synthase family protein [Streptomyces oceani]OEV02421.1 glucose dehydrogenase [Streptomyces oceani]